MKQSELSLRTADAETEGEPKTVTITESLSKLECILPSEVVNQLAADGYVIVPRQPTNEMISAGGEACQEHCDLTMITAISVYNAMIAVTI